MMSISFKHTFVPIIPDYIEDGVIYVCIKYNTVIHKCACGCGEEVVTPISPNGWAITYHGETVSLSPSIGNWSYNCRSHYWIKEDSIIWAETWSNKKIKNSRKNDKKRRKNFFQRLFR